MNRGLFFYKNYLVQDHYFMGLSWILHNFLSSFYCKNVNSLFSKCHLLWMQLLYSYIIFYLHATNAGCTFIIKIFIIYIFIIRNNELLKFNFNFIVWLSSGHFYKHSTKWVVSIFHSVIIYLKYIILFDKSHCCY